MSTTRRDFIKSTGLLTAAAFSPFGSVMAELKTTNQLGIQLFSVPKLLSEDFVGGIKLLSDLGYKEIEMFGPFPFSAEKARKGWEGAAKMLGFSGSGYFGRDVKDVKKILNDHGLKTTGTHTDLDTLLQHMGPLAEAANRLGQKYVTLPSIPDDQRRTLDDYRKMADTFNTIGASAKKHGLRFGYHNHGYGFRAIDGKVPFEVLVDNTDPKLVFLEMDIFWTTAAGADPVHYLQKYANRYKMLHLKDMTEKKTFSGDGGDASQWFPLFPYMTSAGQGVMDWKELLATAKKIGVEHYYVEQDLVANPKDALGKSAAFLTSRI
jgi:sugar phosphate isomerase/epimerase